MFFDRSRFVSSGAMLLSWLLSGYAYAATPIDLSKRNSFELLAFSSPAQNPIKVQELNRSVDFKNTLHVRFQETYLGYPVWGADGIAHVSYNDQKANIFLKNILASTKTVANGVLYENLSQDLTVAPSIFVTNEAKNKSFQKVLTTYIKTNGKIVEYKNPNNQLMIYVDKNNKAHWAYWIQFDIASATENSMPQKPNYIMDAISYQIYEKWDAIKTYKNNKEWGGGFGGNIKIGQFIYDGLSNNLPKLDIKRDTTTKTCFLQNNEVFVGDYRNKNLVLNFPCDAKEANHNNVYWDGDLDAVNGGYSPGNDALFGGAVIKKMYADWYGLPVLTRDGKPMVLKMIVHRMIDNAFWDGSKMIFGDGVNIFYPLTSLGVAAHEISHGFTEQHSNLVYTGQAGGLNEAYSDMAAQAAEYFAYGKNTWQIGPEIFKAKNKALRYMDQPSKDCEGKQPGNLCSIDDATQFRNGLNVHFSSGVYNRFFYLLATTPGWDTKKAFDLMVQANNHYWTSTATFNQAACGVLNAAKDYGYNLEDVRKAFDIIKVTTNQC